MEKNTEQCEQYKAKRERLQITLSPVTHERMLIEARKEGRSRSEMIGRLVEQALDIRAAKN